VRLRKVEIEVLWEAGLAAGAPAGPAAPVGATDEHGVRAAYHRRLDEAERQGHREVSLHALGVGAGGLTVTASGKIMAQEAIRFARSDPAHVRRISCAPDDRAGFEPFRKVVEGYVRHFLEVLAWGPLVTVDAIIEVVDGIVLVERSNPPFGFALPGGFVDYGESLEEAVRREAAEETGLELSDLRQFHTYSDPSRDPRFHTVSTVFAAKAEGAPRAGDDAAAVRVVKPEEVPGLVFAFDHGKVLADWLSQHR
jgi:ADP-ribose pyrophosphatase YjhB (NUDIX family)